MPEDSIDLVGHDVDAVLDDDLLASSDDAQKTVGVEIAEVAGAQESVARERVTGRRLVPVIAVHEKWPTDLHLADRNRFGRRGFLALVRPGSGALAEHQVVGRLIGRGDPYLAVDGNS